MINKQPHQRDLRQGRYAESGLYYFITTNTANQEKLLFHSSASSIVLDALKWLNNKDRISLIAAVVMPDHLHFVAELGEVSLSKMMHSLKSFTANEINKTLGRNGQVWERQYYEHVIRNEKGLLDTVKYCLENPVRKGLVDDFRRYKHSYCVYDME